MTTKSKGMLHPMIFFNNQPMEVIHSYKDPAIDNNHKLNYILSVEKRIFVGCKAFYSLQRCGTLDLR